MTVLSMIERRPALTARVWHVEVLTNAGRPYVGEWAPLPCWYRSEPEAMRAVEDFRALDRSVRGWARSYRVSASLTEVAAEPAPGWTVFAREFDAFLSSQETK